MPLTNAERVARFRAKKKANEAEYAEYKRKNAQEQRKSRCKKMMQEQKQPKRIQKQIVEKRRADTRKRVAKSRALKKEQQKDAEAWHQPFRSASAFGKALNLEKIFSDAPAINGISMAHLLVNNRGATAFYVLSSDVQTHATADELTVDRTDPAESDDAAVGSDDTAAEVALDIQVKDWCAVWYDGELYPGEVKSKVGDNYEVSTMARAGGYLKFPRQEDKIFYSKDKVEKKLECPVLLNARGIYKFPDFP